jgi:transposase-like protein
VRPEIPKAVAELRVEGQLPQGWQLRPVKYLNNLIEQDHRFIKRLVRAGLGFCSFLTAWRTLVGYETMNMMMNMIRKGQIRGVILRGNLTKASRMSFMRIPTLMGHRSGFVE